VNRLALYTRRECGLCREAEALLEDLGVAYEQRDVDTREEWTDAYGLEVPVLVALGPRTGSERVIIGGRFDTAPELRRRLARAGIAVPGGL
jgi:glutaredoxin